MLAAAWIVEVVAREGWAPVLQHPLEPAVGKMRLHLILRQAGEAETCQGRIQPQGHVVEHQLPEGNAMRAPGEAPGMMALEIAIDEMAEKLGLDPIEFRIRNDTQVDPGEPLAALLAAPARRMPPPRRRPLRLERAEPAPGKVRDGRWLVGLGVAAAFRNNLVTNSAARVRLDRRGMVTVETDMTDIGTGSYTIIAQTAAEMMGVPLDRVVGAPGRFDLSGLVRLGRAIRCQLLDRRRLCRLRQAARGRGAEARASIPPTSRSPTASVALGQSQCAARRGRG